MTIDAEISQQVIADLNRENDRLREAMSYCSGHDRAGLDHLADALRLAEENDNLRAAIRAHREVWSTALIQWSMNERLWTVLDD